MILAGLKDSGNHPELPPRLEAALDFLRRQAAAAPPDGRYEIDGERVFALVQRYLTSASALPQFECHQKYIDVQYIARGTEAVFVAPRASMALTQAYDPGKDVCFGRVAPGEWSVVTLRAGQFCVLFPADAHAPKMAAGAPAAVLKIVVKVAV